AFLSSQYTPASASTEVVIPHWSTRRYGVRETRTGSPVTPAAVSGSMSRLLCKSGRGRGPSDQRYELAIARAVSTHFPKRGHQVIELGRGESPVDWRRLVQMETPFGGSLLTDGELSHSVRSRGGVSVPTCRGFQTHRPD